MKINEESVIRVFNQIADNATGFSYANRTLNKDECLLKQWGVPRALRHILINFWTNDDIWINTAYIKSLANMIKVNRDDSRAINDGLLLIGGASNGDPLVVDVKSSHGAVGFINHEIYWCGGAAREVFALIDTYFEKALERLYLDDRFPFDYDEAVKMNETGN